jgi:cysteine desulfurase family protein
MEETYIYLDHAATSWPKPPEVVKAVVEALQHDAANPGRGSHRMAIRASRVLFETRAELAKLFHLRNPNDISFASNTTEALNTAIKGFLKKGDHAICTSVEHNSVRRPLEYVSRTRNVQLTYVKTDEKGVLNLKEVEQAFQANTKLLVCTHSSNLLGTIQPVAELAYICRKRGVRLLVDAAQTAGCYPLDIPALGIDMLAFPGHKGLLGPQGTGGLYIHPDVELEPLLHGGTGSQSEQVSQPAVRPDRYESGTQNVPGLAGLRAGVRVVRDKTTAAIYEREWQLTQRMMEGLLAIRGVHLLGPEIGQPKTGIVSFVMGGKESSEVAHRLDRDFGIAVRAGYHCTPLAHETAGTIGQGAVRASIGFTTTEDEVDSLVEAITCIAAST